MMTYGTQTQSRMECNALVSCCWREYGMSDSPMLQGTHSGGDCVPHALHQRTDRTCPSASWVSPRLWQMLLTLQTGLESTNR